MTLTINRSCSFWSFLSIYCEVMYWDYCYCSSLICLINIISQLLYIRKSLIIWSTNQQVILQIYSFLVALFRAGTLLVIIIFIGCLVGLSNRWWLVRGKLLLSFKTFSFSKPQVTEDVSPRPTTLNRKRYPIEVTVIG